METDENEAGNVHLNQMSSLLDHSDKSINSSLITQESNPNKFDLLKVNMIDHLVYENKAFFRNQQINDPDITENERRSIVENLLEESHKRFLFRFGSHITDKHLEFFENQHYNLEDEYEVQYLLKDIRDKLKNRTRDVRNRRYAALQKMLNTTSYFSEKEMMSREPLLYEQLIGRYMTDREKRIRDGLDSDIEFSDVLLERISNNHVTELKQKQESEEQYLNEYDSDDSISEDAENTPSHKNGIIDDKLFPQTPSSFRQHWGEFDSKPVETNIVEAAKKPSTSSKQNYITAEEKDLLKEEFIGIMHTKFLSGEDKEFDYSQIDDNDEYDNLELQSQDHEDKYFDDDDDMNNGNDNYQQSDDINNDSSEDELDAYIKQISK